MDPQPKKKFENTPLPPVDAIRFRRPKPVARNARGISRVLLARRSRVPVSVSTRFPSPVRDAVRRRLPCRFPASDFSRGHRDGDVADHTCCRRQRHERLSRFGLFSTVQLRRRVVTRSRAYRNYRPYASASAGDRSLRTKFVIPVEGSGLRSDWRIAYGQTRTARTKETTGGQEKKNRRRYKLHRFPCGRSFKTALQKKKNTRGRQRTCRTAAAAAGWTRVDTTSRGVAHGFLCKYPVGLVECRLRSDYTTTSGRLFFFSLASKRTHVLFERARKFRFSENQNKQNRR